MFDLDLCVLGLNPKSFKTLRQRKRDLVNPMRSIIDGDLVYKFSDLSVSEKYEMSKKGGFSMSDLMDDLAELDRMVAHF